MVIRDLLSAGVAQAIGLAISDAQGSVESRPTSDEPAGEAIDDAAAAERHLLLSDAEPHRFSTILASASFDRPAWRSFANVHASDLAMSTRTSPRRYRKPANNRPLLSAVPELPQHPDRTGQTSTHRHIVMIDPGHGGSDPGSEGANGLLEKDLTLDIARRAQLFLSEFDDIEVQLTRDDDIGLSRQNRVEAIRRSNADIVISLHFNHLPQTDVTLVESYYAGHNNIIESLTLQQQGKKAQRRTPEPDLGFTAGSRTLAAMLHEKVFQEVSHDNHDAIDAGVKQETLYVLTRSFTPGVLIELTCLSNPDEAERLVDEDYRNRLAAALVDGVRNYVATLDQPMLAANDSSIAIASQEPGEDAQPTL